VRSDRPQAVDDPKTGLSDVSQLRLRFFDLSDVHDDIYKRTIIVAHLRWQPG
jgi:hypothetical protein